MRYVERAKILGIDIENPTQMFYLMKGIQFGEALVRSKKNNRASIAEELGTDNPDEVTEHRKNPLLGKAIQLVFDIWMEEMRENDLRQVILNVFNDYPGWLKNMSRIAQGREDTDGKKPIDRDAINAFVALSNSPLNDAFMKALYAPETANTPEQAYLQMLEDDLVVRPPPLQIPPPADSTVPPADSGETQTVPDGSSM